MSRTITLSDEHSGTILKLLRQEALAPYASAKEKARAEDAAKALLDTPWVPEEPSEIRMLPPGMFQAMICHLSGVTPIQERDGYDEFLSACGVMVEV